MEFKTIELKESIVFALRFCRLHGNGFHFHQTACGQS